MSKISMNMIVSQIEKTMKLLREKMSEIWQ